MKKTLLLLIPICSLCLPNGCGGGASSPPAPTPDVATHFSVVPADTTPTAGATFNFTVTALDGSNGEVSSYAGTVHFTSSDGQAMLPANSTLTNGTGTFSATMKTAGGQTIAATDTITASITGTSSSITVSAAAATHFSVTGPATATTGTAFNFWVTPLDAWNNATASYSGTAHFTSTDAQAALPADSTLIDGHWSSFFNKTGPLSATMKTAGGQTITATDTATASITGTSNPINVTAPPATHFSLAVPANATVGTAFDITVTALDASNNLAMSYSGTVHFTSTDAHAELPSNSMLMNGTANFPVGLKTVGSQTITATDTATASITGSSSSINVSASTAENPVPLINQPLSPDAAVPGGAAFTLTVSGNGFVSGSVVHWNGSARATNFVSNSMLTASILATDIASLNTASLTVVNPAPGCGTSNVAYFEITKPTSWVALISPGVLPSDGVSVAVGDFNGDGKLDLAVANISLGNPGPISVSVLLGNGDGTFQPAVNYSAGSYPSSVTVADFNGDGKLDLAVANNGSNNVSILLGNGDGTFQPAVDYSAGSNPSSVTVADFNGDGKLDLAVANNGSNNVSILLGNGDGTFQPAVEYGAGSNPTSVTVADFNGDGKLDLAVANNGSNNVSILLGNGDGTFQPDVNFAAGSGPSSLAVGDFNGDGKLDLAVANNGSNNVSILLANGDGTFQPAVEYSAGESPSSVVVGDFNGDNKLDVAVANNGNGNSPMASIIIFLGNGDGTFQPAVEYSAYQGASSMAVGDFNGDSRLDLAVTDPVNGWVDVLLQPEAASGPNATLSATEMRFECRNVTSEGCQCITIGSAMLSNFGDETLSISSVTVTGPFSSGNNCGTSLEPGQSCTFRVGWLETTGEGLLSFFDNAEGSPQTVSLVGEKECTPSAGAANKADLAAKPAGCVRK